MARALSTDFCTRAAELLNRLAGDEQTLQTMARARSDSTMDLLHELSSAFDRSLEGFKPSEQEPLLDLYMKAMQLLLRAPGGVRLHFTVYPNGTLSSREVRTQAH